MDRDNAVPPIKDFSAHAPIEPPTYVGQQRITNGDQQANSNAPSHGNFDFPVARNDHSEYTDEKHTDDGLRRSTRNKEPSAKALENIASYNITDSIKQSIKIDQGLDDGVDPQNRKEALGSNEAQYWLLAEEEEAASHRYHNTTTLVKRRG